MKKGFLMTSLISLALACLMLLSGCGMVKMDQQKDYAQIVATVNGTEITKAQFVVRYEWNKLYYIYQYQNYYGAAPDEESDTIKAEFEKLKEQTLDTMIREEIVLQQVKKGGFDVFTEDEIKAAMKQQYDATDEQINGAVAQVLDQLRQIGALDE